MAVGMPEFVENPENRCPVILLLDTSGSMSGQPIQELNRGLAAFKADVLKDSQASLSVEVAMITFGPIVKLTQDFVTIDQFTPPTLEVDGLTPMGGVIEYALDFLENRKQTYKDNGILYYRPWVFLITDGAPTDSWQLAAQRLREAEAQSRLSFFAVGVKDADMNILKQISPPQRPPVIFGGVMIYQYFMDKAKSMQPIQGFIADSYHFYQIAKDGYLKASQGFEIHRQNDALISIIFSALALEAFINEVLSLAKDAKQAGESEAFLDKLIDAIDESASKKSTREKFMLASEALNSSFKKGENPYQNFADLFRLRDCLSHLKPEDRIEEGENGEFKYLGRKLSERLRSKGIFQNHTQVESITLLVSTAKAAQWACNTASIMVNAILDKIPKSFSNNNQVINLYRTKFQPPVQ